MAWYYRPQPSFLPIMFLKELLNALVESNMHAWTVAVMQYTVLLLKMCMTSSSEIDLGNS